MAAGSFAPDHLGELTGVVPFELVEAMPAETCSAERRLRILPSRFGVCFCLAMWLFPEIGDRLVWEKMTTALAEMTLISPPAKALRDQRHRPRSAPQGAVRSAGRPIGPADRSGSECGSNYGSDEATGSHSSIGNQPPRHISAHDHPGRRYGPYTA
ncbi:transposase domain-containing protein [Streptomyces sp. NPDC058457]|uniref:transposase domain-containing protein n=1 Tax=Streptomyces sp. NPDC058457 TaxID=3346507 RepID=UPI003667BAE9